MYKIHVNDHLLCLCSNAELKSPPASTENRLFLPYLGKKKLLLQILDKLEKAPGSLEVTVYHKAPDQLWETYTSIYKVIEAAGGVVFNPENKALVIFRRGSWDLPKGKIDPGETPAQAALREVEEETGLRHLTLGDHLTDTWHTYELKGRRILKKTWWYRMQTTDNQLFLQKEEDIEDASWADLKDFLRQPPGPVYSSILEVMKTATD